MMACPADVMAQETVFLSDLQAAKGYKLQENGQQLHLLNDKGQVTIIYKKQ